MPFGPSVAVVVEVPVVPLEVVPVNSIPIPLRKASRTSLFFPLCCHRIRDDVLHHFPTP
jgi:hypothetical protein